MKVTKDFLKARQMAFYFLQYRELPGAKKQEIDPEETMEEFAAFRFLFKEYQKLDNSPEDYDPRSGHLLLAEEHCIGRALQISYQGDDTQGQISRIFVDEPEHGFQEDHLIRTKDSLHSLSLWPGRDGCLLEATHWNLADPARAHKQTVRLG